MTHFTFVHRLINIFFAGITMAPNKPKITYTKLFIDNEWVDSVSGKTFATCDPAIEKE